MSKKRLVDKKHLFNLRKSTEMTQKEFASMLEVPVDNIRSWEQGRRMLTADQFRAIKQKLGYVDSSAGSIRVMIDYLRITFKHVSDLDYFCRKFLYCPLSEFVSDETKLMMYTHLWRRGDIWIFDYADKSQTDNYQITLQLSGQGCRQFELIMEREQTTWAEVLQNMYFERKDMKVTRLDIAMDEMYKSFEHESEHFYLSDMISKVYQGEVVFDRLKTWNYIGGGLLNSENPDAAREHSQGVSLYFGSRQSNLYFNFYEKRFELARKENMSVVEALEVFGVWNRYELRLSQGKAQVVVEEFVFGVDLAEIAKGILNKEIQVYSGTNSYGAFLPDKKWQFLFGGVEPFKLSVSPEPYSIEKTIKWLLYQVADTLALVDGADKIMDTKYLDMVLKSGEVTERGQKILEFLNPSDKLLIQNYLEDSV